MTTSTPKKHTDWQIVTICTGYVIEVDCNSGARRGSVRISVCEAL